jgi:hypothetical protein
LRLAVTLNGFPEVSAHWGQVNEGLAVARAGAWSAAGGRESMRSSVRLGSERICTLLHTGGNRVADFFGFRIE